MDIILLLYGLAFVILGVIVLFQPKRESTFDLAAMLWLLGAFGLVHGLGTWMRLWGQVSADLRWEGARLLVSTVSFLFLLEFGRRLVRTCAGQSQGRAHRVGAGLGRWIYLPLVGGLLMGLAVSEMPRLALEIWSRYLLGFPGALLTGIGLLWYYRVERTSLEHLRVRGSFRAAGGAFILYSVVTGLVVPSAGFYPASVLNEGNWLASFGFPVQYFRMVIAMVAVVAVANLLRIFNFETQDKLRSALASLQRSLAEVRRLGRRNERILETTGEGIVGLDRQGRASFANPAALRMLGYEEQEVIGKPFHLLAHHTRPDGTAYPLKECPSCQPLGDELSRYSDQEQFWRKDGTQFPIEFTCAVLQGEDELVGTVLAFRDISDRRESEKRLRLAGQVIETTPEGILITDDKGLIVAANPAFLSATGYTEAEVLGRTPAIIRSEMQDAGFYEQMWRSIRESGLWQGEIWNRHKSGANYPEWLTITAMRDETGQITNYIGIYSDISARDQMRERLHHLAYYDALTRLPNRHLFADHLRLALAQAKREHNKVALMFIDLDKFKNINDTLGHSMGDKVLIGIADRLRHSVREADTVARMGGDEFTVVLPELGEAKNARVVAQKILEGLQPPLVVEGHEFHITGSIGIALYPEDASDPESLIRNADTAMYRAKEMGRNNYQFYTAEMSTRFRERVALEDSLRKAIERDSLQLVYQPQMDVGSDRIVGVEALARWRSPEYGDVPPSTFIPVAEESGLITAVGEWVLRTACLQAKKWDMERNSDFRVAVNLSGHQLRQKNLAKLVSSILDETGCRPDQLELELTETVLMENAEPLVSTLREFNQMGIKISIDDFGTGYSSLSYLKRFAIDKLKIDQSFVQDIPGDTNDSVIATTIIAMAHTLHLRVIAEGVETQQQLAFLKANGCDEIQGFLFARPTTAEDISRMFTKGREIH